MSVIGGRRRGENQLVARADHVNSFHDISQLPDISRPPVVQHGFDGHRCQGLLHAVFLVESLQKAFRDGDDIFFPLTEGRQLNQEHAETVVQVFPELLFFHHLLQIHVGGADDAHIHRDVFHPAHPADFVVFQGSQQLGLQCQRHVADFIQKDRPAGSRFKETDFSLGQGPGEGAAFIAEQFGFQQLIRHGRAVNADEGLAGPFRLLMDQPGHHVLSGAAFSQNDHAAVGGCNGAYGLEHALHGRAVGDEPAVILQTQVVQFPLHSGHGGPLPGKDFFPFFIVLHAHVIGHNHFHMALFVQNRDTVGYAAVF